MQCQLTSWQLQLLLLLQICWLADVSRAQRTTYSLQAALDELHRRETDAAKYPLNAPPSRFFGSALGAAGNEPDYWDDDTEYPASSKTQKSRNRYRLNKELAKYLERENNDADHVGLSLEPFGDYEFDETTNENNNLRLEQKKRSSSLFRERDNNYDNQPTSVFRERESQSIAEPLAPHQAELTDQFLREIEEASEHERKERYKEALRHLWEKYQQQENEVDSNLRLEEKKRMRMPPYYMLMQKKRSNPVLPWLPYSVDKKKRFPVAKRSAKRSTTTAETRASALGKTDERVARELSELFGKPLDAKKKRSTDDAHATVTTLSPITKTDAAVAMTEMRLEQDESKQQQNATHISDSGKVRESAAATNHAAGYHSGHSEMEHKHRKRSNHQHSHEEHSGEETDDDDEHDHEHEHEDHEDFNEDSDEDDHDEFDEDDEEERRRKKKKRDTPKNGLAGQNEHAIMRSKKSVDWSKYFGLDRKKKSTNAANAEFKKHSSTHDIDEINNGGTEADDKKQNTGVLDPEKLESMDRKLQNIEDFIIDETIKYTGAHEGISNQDDIRRLKDHVLSRLTAAYSLEKMRRSLDKLRQSVEKENHLLHNVIESESEENDIENWKPQKRVAIKKESADDGSEIKAKEIKSGSIDESEANASNDEMKKKKKRNGYLRYPELPNDMEQQLATGPYESFNDAYLGNKNYLIGSNQCPLIESMAERCRGVGMLSGDLNQELLPICGVHQICYLCGTSQIACDYQYLAEAEKICGTNNECQADARSVLMILRGTPGPQLGPRQCLKNPCLYSAMREIGL